ncbi:MAG: hypothetical protein AB1798_09230 [Spirochaetota bacterium]
MQAIENLYSLFYIIDRERTFPSKIANVIYWIERLPEVEACRIICFNSHEVCRTSEVAALLPAHNPQLFPKEPSILNGKSTIPQDIFPPGIRSTVTVYYPFFRETGELSGALLVKCGLPQKFLKKYNKLLGLLSSKIKDIIEIAVFKQTLRDSQAVKYNSEMFTPEILGKLMNFLNLPMYMMDQNGRFIMVNKVFLESFHYDSLENLKTASNFFFETDHWSQGLRRIAEEKGHTRFLIKVRTGRGDSLVVQDSATLIGKNTLGILFDTTDFVSLNEELQQTLESQKTLNEKLVATSSTLRKTQVTAMKTLARLAEYRDKETGNHLHRICEYINSLTTEIYKHQPYNFTISREYVDDMYLSGMLHDIGKVGVPDSILLKEGSLDKTEWEIMRHNILTGDGQSLITLTTNWRSSPS